jgi:threonine/homoserine/homoserine lactone efflux protein
VRGLATGVAIAAARLLRSRPRAGLIVGRVSGATMILVAIALVVEQVVHG